MARLTRYAVNRAGFGFYVSQKERQISFNRAAKNRGTSCGIQMNYSAGWSRWGKDGTDSTRGGLPDSLSTPGIRNHQGRTEDGCNAASLDHRHLAALIVSVKVRAFLGVAGSFTISGPPADEWWIQRKLFDPSVAKMTKPRIGVLTSGGDCPGLNAVLRGVVSRPRNWAEVLGFLDGFEGLLPPGNYMLLDRRRTAGIMPRGGTILGHTNRGHFRRKIGAGDRIVVAEEAIANAREV
jgi:hypothetical protein